MKKNIILAIVMCISLVSPAFAQFVLKPDGFFHVEISDQNYVVHNFEGQSKEDLFSKSIAYLEKFKDETLTQNNPEKRGITRNDPQLGFIKFYGRLKPFASTKLTYYADGRKHRTELWLNYYMTIHFKDGKIRFDSPDFNTDVEIKGNIFWAGSSIGVYVYIKGERSLYDCKYVIFNEVEKLKLPEIKQHIENYFNKLVADFIIAMNQVHEEVPKIDDNW